MALLIGSGARLSAAGFHGVDAVVWADRLVVVTDDGKVAAWNLTDGAIDRAAGSTLALSNVRRLALAGERLFAATDSEVYGRTGLDDTWQRLARYSKPDSDLLSLLGIGDTPLLVFGDRVINPLAPRTYLVPELRGQIKTNVLRLHASATTEQMAWFGTGHGEWGGHLAGLDLKTGNWVQYYDALHYVTGIAPIAGDNVVVAWSMSHFTAHTRIREHGKDGIPTREYEALSERYYQRIVRNTDGSSLYGIEENRLVRIVDGKPEEIVSLPGQVFEGERLAIGVAPGIRALLPVAGDSILVVPNSGAPMQVTISQKKVRTFALP